MTEAIAQFVAETELPLPLPLLLGVLGLLGTIVGALIAARSKRWRTPADDREDRKVGIEADERLLKRFEEMLKERDSKIDALNKRVDELFSTVQEQAQERTVLVDLVYALIRIIRDLDGTHLIPWPLPKGIFVAGLKQPADDH